MPSHSPRRLLALLCCSIQLLSSFFSLPRSVEDAFVSARVTDADELVSVEEGGAGSSCSSTAVLRFPFSCCTRWTLLVLTAVKPPPALVACFPSPSRAGASHQQQDRMRRMSVADTAKEASSGFAVARDERAKKRRCTRSQQGG